MNLQIQKLINNNSLSRTQVWDTETEKYAEICVNQQKLVELVIEKCGKIAIKNLSLNNTIEYYNEIKQYFGVK